MLQKLLLATECNNNDIPNFQNVMPTKQWHSFRFATALPRFAFMSVLGNYYGQTSCNRKQTDMLKGSVKMLVNALYDLMENIKFHTVTSSSYEIFTD